ncbi:hypothetical protein QTI24_30805 [Variovorax sp. J22P240]|uniref:hypothetical protein n=1 Tax=Variovorax sp. J22P240 TaxID=3053514 RepID=UPI002577C21F|nr:hypothetical protein [Variovorax sp. J22P240]MDM0003010.1 hypothetical protein [Variovorax sp. J22P240]
MADEEKPKTWWQTLPGIITSLTAAITAIAGLVVAFKQAGWIGSPPPAQPPSVTAPASSSWQAPAVAAAPASSSRTSHAVTLPAMRDYKLGLVTFTLLSAEVSPQTSEKDALRIRLRMMNNDAYDTNFWDRSFRLLVDGVPTAPESDLNELVRARSAKEGTVLFVIPHGTAAGNLEVSHHDEQTSIPLAFAAPR